MTALLLKSVLDLNPVLILWLNTRHKNISTQFHAIDDVTLRILSLDAQSFSHLEDLLIRSNGVTSLQSVSTTKRSTNGGLCENLSIRHDRFKGHC